MAIRTKPIPSCPKCGRRMVLNCDGVREIDPISGKPEDDDEWLVTSSEKTGASE